MLELLRQVRALLLSQNLARACSIEACQTLQPLLLDDVDADAAFFDLGNSNSNSDSNSISESVGAAAVCALS